MSEKEKERKKTMNNELSYLSVKNSKNSYLSVKNSKKLINIKIFANFSVLVH